MRRGGGRGEGGGVEPLPGGTGGRRRRSRAESSFCYSDFGGRGDSPIRAGAVTLLRHKSKRMGELEYITIVFGVILDGR